MKPVNDVIGQADVLMIAALREEYGPARAVPLRGFLGHPGIASWTERDQGTTTPYEFGLFELADGSSFGVALTRQTRMGSDSTSAVLGTLIERLRPACIAMPGVCAGKPTDLVLGDVIIADATYLRLEGKKKVDAFYPDLRTRSLPERWLRAAQDFQPDDLACFQAPTAEESRRWLLECLLKGENPRTHIARDRYFTDEGWRQTALELLSEGLVRRAGADPELTEAGRAAVQEMLFTDVGRPRHLPFRVHVGPIATGPYVDASDPWDILTSEGVRTVIGLEMEAAAVAAAASRAEIPRWIVVKGVMDHAKSDKGDRYKAFAARASAEVLWKFLVEQRIHNPDTLLRHSAAGRTPSFHLSNEGTNPLPASNLRPLLDAFVGRKAELEHCRTLLEQPEVRLVTLVGPPGGGKTRLAIEVAQALRAGYSDHVYFVELSTVGGPDLVLAAITRSLNVDAGDPLIDALRELFRGQPALIILDNFELVVDAAPRVGELLGSVPELKVLATSDEPLAIRPERLIEVGPLTDEEAEALFAARCARAYTSDLGRQAITTLCSSLDNLPLAIELIAGRGGLLTPDAMLNELVGRQLLDGFDPVLHVKSPLRDASERQMTLHRAIQWIFDLLTQVEQRLFVQLSVFEGGWTLATARRVVDGGTTVAFGTAMAALLNKRLVRHAGGTESEARYDLYLSLRRFGRERVEQDPAVSSRLLSKHAAVFLDLAERLAPELDGPAKRATLEHMAEEHANFQTSLNHFISHGETLQALLLARSLAPYWRSRDYAEGYASLESTLELDLPPDATRKDLQLQAAAMMASGQLAIRLFKLDAARRRFSRVLQVALAIADQSLEATALSWEALVDVELTAYDSAEAKLQRALSIFQGQNDKINMGHCRDSLGTLAAEAGDYQRAAELFEQSIATYPPGGDPDLVAWVQVDLAQLCLLRRDLAGCREYATVAYEVGRDLDDKGLCTWAANVRGLAESAAGVDDKARAWQGDSLTLAMLLGNMRTRLRALEGFAVIAAHVRQDEAAVTLLAALDHARRTIGLPRANTEKLLVADLAAARSRLPAEEAAAAADRGRRMSLDQATELARRI